MFHPRPGDGCGEHPAGADPTCVLLKTGGCGWENGIVLAAQQVRMYFSTWGKNAATKRASAEATQFNHVLAGQLCSCLATRIDHMSTCAELTHDRR
jgi:hypothetical protein